MIDLPVGEYFRKFIDSIISFLGQGEGEGHRAEERISVEDISQMINDYSASDIKVFLKKIWLISYHRWIMANCNGSTQEMMDGFISSDGGWLLTRAVMEVRWCSMMEGVMINDRWMIRAMVDYRWVLYLYMYECRQPIKG